MPLQRQPIIFDIETGRDNAIDLDQFAPDFEAPGNYKDPVKIAAYKEEKLVEWRKGAALSAVTGQVLAIGLRTGGVSRLLHGDEKQILSDFWSAITFKGAFTSALVGFNVIRFDVPFLVRRSWKLGVPVPYAVMNGRYLNSAFVDLMQIYQCGDYQASISLDRMARWLGVGAKNGDGADFAMLLETEPEKALAYLENDLRLTELCALALGVVDLDEVSPRAAAVGDY